MSAAAAVLGFGVGGGGGATEAPHLATMRTSLARLCRVSLFASRLSPDLSPLHLLRSASSRRRRADSTAAAPHRALFSLLLSPSDPRMSPSCPDGSDSGGLEDNGGGAWLRGDRRGRRGGDIDRPGAGARGGRSARVELPEVQQALHANRTHLKYHWSMCSHALVHSGEVHGGHYYAFIRPTLSDQWILQKGGLYLADRDGKRSSETL